MKTALFCTVLICCCWFFSIGSWNQLSRYDAIRALAESGTVCIDDYLANPQLNINTGDWSAHDGHYYSNKAPLPILLGAAVYAPLYHLERAAAVDPAAHFWQNLNFWWINFWCSALPTALTALFFFKLLRQLSYTVRRSLFWALALILCTPLWPYATQLWGHNLAVFCLTAALFHTVRPHSAPRDSILAGLYGAAAVLADYMAAALLPFLAAFLLWQTPHRSRALLLFILGGLPPLAIHCLYHYTCFGNPVLPATFYNNPLFTDERLAGGLFSAFKPVNALELLIGIRRGLLWCAPLAVFALPGACQLHRERPQNSPALIFCAAGSFILPWLINAAFNGWHGGAAVGPRYLLITLPSVFLLASGYHPASCRRQWLLIATAGISSILMLLCAAAAPLVGENIFNPLFSYIPAAVTTPQRLAKVLSPGIWSGWRPYSDILMLLAVFLCFGCFCRRKSLCLPPCPPLPGIRHCLRRHFLTLLPALLLTLLFPSLTQFLFDETALLQRALEASANGVFATAGLGGTMGQRYGALPINCYQILLLFTRTPAVMVFLKSALFLALTLWALRRLQSTAGSALRFAPLLFLYAPYCWLYSRMLWDNVFQLPLIVLATTFFTEASRKMQDSAECTPAHKWLLPLLLALFCSVLAIWIHSMSLTFFAAILITATLLHHKLLRRQWRTLLVTAVPVLLLAAAVMVPRLCDTWQKSSRHGTVNSAAATPFLTMLGESCTPVRFLSNRTVYAPLDYTEEAQGDTPAVSYHLDGLFAAAVTPPSMRRLWLLTGYATTAIAALLWLAGVFALFRQRRHYTSPAWQLGLLCIVATLLHIAMLLILRPLFFLHYLQPVLPATLCLSAIGAAYIRGGRHVTAAWCICSATAIILLMFQLRLTGGQSSPPAGMTLATQWNAARLIARSSLLHRDVRVVNMTWQYRASPQTLTLLTALAKEDSFLVTAPPPQPPCRLFLANPQPPNGRLSVVREKAAY